MLCCVCCGVGEIIGLIIAGIFWILTLGKKWHRSNQDCNCDCHEDKN